MKYFRYYYWDWEKFKNPMRIKSKIEDSSVLWIDNENLEKWIIIEYWDINKNKLFFKKNWLLRDYLPNWIEDPTISEKLKNTLINKWLIKENKDVQFLPTPIEQEWNPDNKIEWYYLCNILNIVEWMINEEKAKMWYSVYHKMAFKKEIDDLNLHIFRLKEHQVAFYISEKIKEVFDSPEFKIDLEYIEIEVG